MAKRTDNPMRIERVAAKEREQITDMSREVRKTREQRRALESEGVTIASGKNEREIKPTKVRLPASPIVGKPADRFEKKQAPPKPHRTPVVDTEKGRSDRGPDADKTRPDTKIQPEPKRRADNPTRQEPQAKDPKREPRQEPQAKEPKHEPRQEPQAKEPKREPRQEPQAKEPKREPSSGRKSEPDKEGSDQPAGKSRKK
jgi:ribonuclease E